MKKTLFIVSVALCLSFTVSGWAGPKKRHCEKDSLFARVSIDSDHAKPEFRRPDKHERYRRCPSRCRGHWETRRIWVPPVYEKVWNPGHYNRNHEWVCGHWIRLEKKPGYWKTEKFWVSNRRY